MSVNSHSPILETSLNDVSVFVRIVFCSYIPRLTPTVPRLCQYHSNVLRTLFHLTRQVQCCCQHERWVRPPDLDLGIESSDIHLCGSQSLLSNS
jgi:hypothetical protein